MSPRARARWNSLFADLLLQEMSLRRPQRFPNMAHLYVMSRSDAPGLLKVGRSDDPGRRAVDLQSGHCFLVHVVAVFYNVGHRERVVHEYLQDSRVDGGAGREWFRASLLEIYQAIARATAGETMLATLPTGPLTPAVLGEYIRYTDDVAEASSAARIRGALASVPGVSRPQVIGCLEAVGLVEGAANYYVGGIRTKKRVYKKNRLFAALIPWMDGDATADETAFVEITTDAASVDDGSMDQDE